MRSRKVIYVLCLISVFILNVFYVNYEFYVWMLMVFLIPLFSLGVFILAKYGVELYFRMPNRRVTQGEKTIFQVKMSNQVPLLLANSEVDFVMKCSNDNTREYKKLSMNTLFDQYVESIELNTRHSGIMIVQSDRVVMYDYLRIFKKIKHFKGITQIPVFPELLPASEKNNYESLEGLEFSNDQWTILSGDSDEVIDFRAYQDGDSMNRIHWKLSVKTDDLIVKKYGDVDDRCIRILVDLTLTSELEFRNHLDKIYQMAYSIGNYYVRSKTLTSFILWDEKNSKLKECSFSTREELEAAMLVLMRQPCTRNAGGKTEAAFEESGLKMAEKPYWITAQHQGSTDYEVIDVAKDDLNQIMETLYAE